MQRPAAVPVGFACIGSADARMRSGRRFLPDRFISPVSDLGLTSFDHRQRYMMEFSSSREKTIGEFERAREQWSLAVRYMTKKVGRGASRAMLVAWPLVEKANREEFDLHHWLVAWPGLDYLALMMGGANEKTVRRAIESLEAAGLIRHSQRFNDSNKYILTIPPQAAEYLSTVGRELQRRRRKRRTKNAPKCPGEWTDGNGIAPKCPPNLDLNLEEPFTKCVGLETDASEDSKEEEENSRKRSGEEDREESESFSATSQSEWSEVYRVIRHHWGERATGLVSVAMKEGVPPDDVLGELRECIENGGDAGDLAHALWHSYSH
jgi:DNA-binding MarR family transcriptional regulator